MRTCCATLIAVLGVCSLASWQNSPADKLKWQEGPSVGDMNGIAEVQVPAGYVYIGAKDTRVLMEAMQNPISGREMGLVAPADLNWFVVFEYDDVGYVRDDERNNLNADAMLAAIRKGTEEGNKERKRRGWPTMTITGWEQPPRYDETTHNLEWAIRGESEGKPVVNFNTRVLGRGGVMRVTLVTEPSTLVSTLPKFRSVLGGFDFRKGQKYAEFRSGDKVAKYGLTALVVGGATAAAVKTGLFKWIWKGLVIGGVAVAGLFRKIFNRGESR